VREEAQEGWGCKGLGGILAPTGVSWDMAVANCHYL